MAESAIVGPTFALRHVGFHVQLLTFGGSAPRTSGFRLDEADRQGSESCLDACPDTDSTQDEVIADHDTLFDPLLPPRRSLAELARTVTLERSMARAAQAGWRRPNRATGTSRTL